MAASPRFLTVNDVADVLNVSVRQVRALLSSGELRGIQVGGRGIWRVEDSALEQYIANQYHRNEQRLRDQASTARGDDRERVEHDDPSST
ncbi:MAG TPA: helix-turn-helix domain-containing protein [Aeromicrobium sp.]|nr:helix-turn-helix domain-containing protein [Aeromicrobium sp.]